MFGFTVENHVLYQRRVRDQTKDRIRLKRSDLLILTEYIPLQKRPQYYVQTKVARDKQIRSLWLKLFKLKF